MKTIDLKIKAKHFKNTDFFGNGPCVIEKAAISQLKTRKVTEWVDGIRVSGKDYTHEHFGNHEFDLLKRKARRHSYGNRVIKTMILTKS